MNFKDHYKVYRGIYTHDNQVWKLLMCIWNMATLSKLQKDNKSPVSESQFYSNSKTDPSITSIYSVLIVKYMTVLWKTEKK